MTYPVLTLRGEIVQRMARAMQRSPAWGYRSGLYSPDRSDEIAEAALSELESRGLITFEEPK